MELETSMADAISQSSYTTAGVDDGQDDQAGETERHHATEGDSVLSQHPVE